MDGLWWYILLKRMILGYPHFWKPPYAYIYMLLKEYRWLIIDDMCIFCFIVKYPSTTIIYTLQIPQKNAKSM